MSENGTFITIFKVFYFPFSFLTFPAVSFLFLGVFGFFSFFTRSAGGAKISGGKGICPSHIPAPDFQVITQEQAIYMTDTQTQNNE